MKKHNPDNRHDNESKLKRTIANTQAQMEAAKEMIADTSSEQTKAELTAKNERRAQAVHDMEIEAKQEAQFEQKRLK